MKDRFEISVKTAMTKNSNHLQKKEIIWKGIEYKMRMTRVKRLFVRVSFAAMVLIIAGIGTLILLENPNPSEIDNYNCRMSAELAQTEFYFAQLIDEKQQEVNKESISDREFYKPFFDDTDSLDKQYEEYKKELDQYGFQEELIRALIMNQQQKLEVLNRLLIEIKKRKNYENRKKAYSI